MKTLIFTTMAAIVAALREPKVTEVVVEGTPMDPLDMMQPRSPDTPLPVPQYREDMKNGAVFPPVDVLIDPETEEATLTDGNARCQARKENGETTITARFRLGNRRDKILAAAAANSAHGQPRTHADRRSAVRLLLSDPELATYSNGYLASKAKVSGQLVEEVRQELVQEAIARGEVVIPQTKRKVVRGGKTYEVDVTAKKANGDSTKAEIDPIQHALDKLLASAKKLNPEQRAMLLERVVAALSASPQA